MWSALAVMIDNILNAGWSLWLAGLYEIPRRVVSSLAMSMHHPYETMNVSTLLCMRAISLLCC